MDGQFFHSIETSWVLFLSLQFAFLITPTLSQNKNFPLPQQPGHLLIQYIQPFVGFHTHLKMHSSKFFPHNSTPSSTQWLRYKQVFGVFCSFLIQISHTHRYSDPSYSTWLKHFWQQWQPHVLLWIMLSLKSFFHSSWQDHLSLTRFSRAALWGSGPDSRTCCNEAPPVFFLGVMLLIVVLLKCKPSPQPEYSGKGFYSLFYCNTFPSILINLSPSDRKTSRSRILSPLWLKAGRFLIRWCAVPDSSSAWIPTGFYGPFNEIK